MATTSSIKVALFWSGGKDSALCLHEVLEEGKFEVCYLVTTLNAVFKRVSMHGIREELLDRQAAAVGIPLKKMWVSEGSNEEYERKLAEVCEELKTENIDHIIFGDIFLEEIRNYREKLLNLHQMKGVFPLWKRSSKALVETFMECGFKAITCCVDSNHLNESWVGKELDQNFMKELPLEVDPCGENGEFHSFVYDGPVFMHPMKFQTGEKVFRPLEIKKTGDEYFGGGFWFLEII